MTEMGPEVGLDPLFGRMVFVGLRVILWMSPKTITRGFE